jgi:AraC-like DNA-binding protein
MCQCADAYWHILFLRVPDSQERFPYFHYCACTYAFGVMENINLGFHIISFLLALLAASILFIFNAERKHSNRLLAFLILLFAYQNLIFLLLFSKIILKVPFLMRSLAPTTFLFGPVSYLYIRSVLNDELKFRKYDWLLILPSVLVLINFIPYYLLPKQEKINYIIDNFYGQKQTQDPGRGYIPSLLYYLIRILWSGIFLFLNFRLIIRFRSSNTPALLRGNKNLLNWLFIFNFLLAVVWIATILRVFMPTLKNAHLTIADLLFGFTIIFICLQLFIRPQILYGIYSPLSLKETEHKLVTTQPGYSDQQKMIGNEGNPETMQSLQAKTIDLQTQINYKTRIENCFNQQKPYLNPDYSLEQMVIDVGIPRYILSAFINREYGMGFREFLNRYRIEFFIENLNDSSWSNLTLEAIAWQCGFNSRSTFISHAKKVTGKTPSELMKS